MQYAGTNLKRLYVAMLSVGLTQLASVSAAETRVLEEILVTAQIRVESLQDVPVSVSAVSGDKLMEAGIDKIEDLQAYVPNLSMSETAIGTNIYIRGIGSGINQGFEQSVGMYVDGISYGRAQLSRAPFLDLERVEVLRGPQNILFGKNSIAGALSIITANPSDVLEGSVSVLYEPDHNEQVVDFVVSGPITDTLSARLAYRNRSMDGYIENITLGTDEPNREEETVRLSFQWRATDDLDFIAKIEKSTFDVIGRQIEIVEEAPGALGLTYSQLLRAGFGQHASVLNNVADKKRSSNGDSSENETSNFTLTANYSLGEHSLTFITGIMDYEYDESCDCDFTGANIFKINSQEEYEQISQEIRFASATGSDFEFLGGVFYQTSELDFRDKISVEANSLLPAAVTQGINSHPNAQLRGLLGNNAGAAIAGTAAPRVFTTDTDIFSAFLQSTWNVNEVVRLTVGGRYTMEEKEGTRRLTYTTLDGSEIPVAFNPAAPNPNDPTLPNQAPGIDLAYDFIFNVTRHNLSGDRTEEKFSPLINAQFDINADTMLYVTFSQGSKSGGFDARSNADSTRRSAAGNIGTFEFEDEKAVSFELGSKMTLLDGAAELNVALFKTEYSDLQVSLFDGTLGFNVGNAGEAETMGMELDGRYRVTDHLTLIGSLAFLDFEFTDYDTGQCNFGETPTSTTSPGNCNYDGRTNQYVADWSGALTADYVVPVSSMEFHAVLDIVFTDDYNPTQTLDPIMQQDGYSKINARLSLVGADEVWEVSLVGKNLTDESIISYANATPLAGTSFNVSSHYAFFEREKTIALQAAYRF